MSFVKFVKIFLLRSGLTKYLCYISYINGRLNGAETTFLKGGIGGVEAAVVLSASGLGFASLILGNI